MELGAIDWVAKPTLGIRSGMEALAEELIGKVKVAAATRPRSTTITRQVSSFVREEPVNDDIGRVVAIGASTGGVEALRHVIGRLPPSAPGILITQHMPSGFTASFARRMNEQCAVTVTEATDGVPIRRGHVYVAPGSRHLEIRLKGKEYVCRLHDDAPVSGHRPSVDVLFHSVAEMVGADAVGVILTGMGRDGASGLLAMRQRGARTLGQSEASCAIYGMPRVAKEFGAVESEMTLDRIADEISKT
jgi:two-component system chemotaxis response regulator CheB